MSSPARSLYLVPPSPVSLGDIARSLADAPESWVARVRHDPRQRFFERLTINDDYDAWLVGWWPGQGIPVHDHGPSVGAVVVTDGSLVENSWPDDGPPSARLIAAGDEPLTFGADHVHAMANLGASPATSIHVYSPALSSMGWFTPSRAEEWTRHEELVERVSSREQGTSERS